MQSRSITWQWHSTKCGRGGSNDTFFFGDGTLLHPRENVICSCDTYAPMLSKQEIDMCHA